MNNPLLREAFPIPFDEIRPEHAEPAIDELLAGARTELEALLAEESAPELLARLDDLTRRLGEANTVVRHLVGVVSSDEWRAAEKAIIPKVSAFYSELGMHQGLWKALSGLDESGLDPLWARYLGLTRDQMRRSGAGLPEDKRERLSALNTELAQLTSRYAQNVQDATAAFELYVDEARLAGLPDRVKDAARRDAEKRGRDGYRLTLHLPSLQPVLTYAGDRELRRELWEASARVGSAGEFDNRALLGDILRLRAEKAELLGYRTFADLVLEDRMAGSGDRAVAFEADLEEKTRPFFEHEQTELREYAAAQGGGDLQPWDVSYWAEKLRKERFDLDEEETRPYFVLDRVLGGAFSLAERLFGVSTTEAQAPGWHEEVRYYEMRGEDGTLLGGFYTDWFPRDTKRGGAWMNQFKVGNPAAGEPHLALMCGNMTPPSGDTPSLLSHREVETVFHEFGHLLHGLLSTVPVRSLSGTSVPWDFVELPSQIMENWTLEREMLDEMAQHYQSGEVLPEELRGRMLAARNFRAASAAMRQYAFGTVDLALHTDPRAHERALDIAREVMPRFSPVPSEEDLMVTRFGHLFASPVGYAAGYYSYKWAEVLDADAFGRFEEEGIFSREVGRAFVESVLSRGNSAPPEALYREFRGRDPEAGALLRRSGLA